MSVAGYTDLFAAGPGFDITGAYLVAKGLLTPPDEFAQQFAKSGNTFAWANVRAANDHADGVAGVGALCFGFLLQAIGYVLQIGGVSSHTDGTWASVLAVSFAAAATGLTYTLARKTRWARVRPYLVRLAHFDRWGTLQDAPNGGDLLLYSEILGLLPEAERYGDGATRHFQRVWHVDRVTGPNFEDEREAESP
jgi:hypothetical protein